MAQILVTGAAGFIGSNLVEALLGRGHRIVGLDNFSHGREENLRPHLAHPAFELIRGDVCDARTVRNAATGADQIVHLAAYKIPRYRDALDTLVVNTEGTSHVFDAARRETARVIVASTSDAYGKSAKLPFHEDGDLVMGPPAVRRWAYAISKMWDEQLAFAYQERFGVPFLVLRLFGGYGPNQNLTWWGGPQSVFIRSALAAQPMPVHGDGTQTRCLTYIDDLIDGFVRLIERPDIQNEVLNLGSDTPVSILELARLCWRGVRDDEPQIELVPYETFGRYEDVRERVPDLGRIRQLIGYAPQVGLEEGLRRTVAWQRRVQHVPAATVAGEERQRLIFIAPAYNEAANLPRLVQEIAGGAELLTLDYTVLLVDDGSTDDTAAVVDELARNHPLERLVHPTNRGVGAAFNTGFARALELARDQDIVVTLEADGTSNLDILPEMFHQLALGRDLVLASCYQVGGGVVRTDPLRVFLSHCANGSAKLVFGLHGISTLSSFYRMYRAAALRALAESFGSPFLESPGFECMLELLARFNDLGFKIAEVPMVLDSSRRQGASKMNVARTIGGYLRLYARRLAGGRVRARP